MRAYSLDRALAFIGPWLEGRSREVDIPGFGVGICHKNEVVFAQAYGLADCATGEVLTTKHLFSIASQSKMFTATAVMRLVECGKLKLDDRIAHYLPWLYEHPDTRFRTITVEQLLWHGAGIVRDGLHADFWQLAGPFPDAAAFQRMACAAELVMEHGTAFKYSNIGYVLLGQLIEKISGGSYTAAMHRYLIEPFGLSTAKPDYDPCFHTAIARGYSRRFRGKRLPAPRAIATRAFAPVTGWYATIGDMCSFMMAQYTDASVVSDRTRHLLHYGQRGHWQPPADRGTQYGLGFMRYTFGGRQIIGHNGTFIAHRSASFFDPRDKLAVVVMANTQDAEVMAIVHGIFGILDYFQTYATAPEPSHIARFNARLSSMWSDKGIVATNKRISSAYLNEWQPFEHAEVVIPEGDDTLRFVEAADLRANRETMRFVFEYDHVVSVNAAGTTMLPEDSYTIWLTKHWSAMHTNSSESEDVTLD